MRNRGLLLIVFGVVALIQLYVPARMVVSREAVLQGGEEFWFETAPIDPSDPFRGRYVILRFKENVVTGVVDTTWMMGDEIFISLDTDANGFARIRSASRLEPYDDYPFVKAKVAHVSGDRLMIAYPFERYYMEESKAPVAETVYNEMAVDTTSRSWAVVRIKDGEAVLEDVMIDGMPIREVVLQRVEDVDEEK